MIIDTPQSARKSAGKEGKMLASILKDKEKRARLIWWILAITLGLSMLAVILLLHGVIN